MSLRFPIRVVSPHVARVRSADLPGRSGLACLSTRAGAESTGCPRGCPWGRSTASLPGESAHRMWYFVCVAPAWRSGEIGHVRKRSYGTCVYHFVSPRMGWFRATPKLAPLPSPPGSRQPDPPVSPTPAVSHPQPAGTRPEHSILCCVLAAAAAGTQHIMLCSGRSWLRKIFH